MYAFAKYRFTHRLVASALVGVLALCVLSLLPAADSSARPMLELGAVSGAARVVDGDTIVIDGRHIRLEGIDAPERGQRCGRWLFGTWDCGAAASEALHRLLSAGPVSCESRGNDKYGRVLGICVVNGEDINAKMVRQGYAWAFVKYSQSYVREESEAREAGVGIWQGKSEPAWLYREKRWAGAETEAPNGCAIKGNISSHGRIYYMPWSPGYAMVKIDQGKGERWFCSEAEASGEGWRPVLAH